MMLYGTPIGVVFLYIGVLFVLVFGLGILYSKFETARNSKKPVLTVDVVIDGLQEDTTTYRKPLYRSLFIADNGDKFSYFLTEEQFGSMEPGWTGKLSYQGTEFVSFERAADSPEGRPKDKITKRDR